LVVLYWLFGQNFHWVQKTTDMVECIKGPDVTPQTTGMKSHLWRQGPVVWPLAKMLQKGKYSCEA
jgi:hypothetical protein